MYHNFAEPELTTGKIGAQMPRGFLLKMGYMTLNTQAITPPWPCSDNVARRRAGCLTGMLPLLAILSASAAQAQFTLATNNNAIEIASYTGPGGAVVIPSITNGLPVTSIGQYAFYFATNLTAVTIPDSITSIGTYAFENTTGLTSVTIPGSVTNIGTEAFLSCTGLTNVTFSNGTPSIGIGAFESCSKLTGPTFPDSITNIGADAFAFCKAVTNVAIPSGVSGIGQGAFAECTSLTSILVDSSNSTYSSFAGVLFDKSQTTLIQCPGGAFGSYVVPVDITNIGASAFFGCTSLTNITIPISVTSIGNVAFGDCFGLTNVTIPAGVTTIGISPFYDCVNLASISVDSNNSAYCSVAGVLFNKNQTTLVESPATVGGNYAIPESVTSLGQSAFFGCSNLTSVAIPTGVTNLGEYAFGFCSNLTGIYFQGGPPTLSNDSLVFDFDSIVTIYYLPGTTGWRAIFDGQPTVLWNPLIQTSATSFGVRTNQFGFNIASSNNLVIVVEACTNLSHPFWQPISTNTIAGGSYYFSDSYWTNYSSRFYRLSFP